MNHDGVLISIRHMSVQDVPAVAKLEAVVFSEPWSENAFSEACNHGDYCYLTALDGERVVGYAGCTIACEDADITNIAVDEEYRRLGIAAQLLRVLKAEAVRRGATTMFLEVRVSNSGAIALYEKEGFATVGRRKGFYRKPDEDAFVMSAGLCD